MRQLQPPVTADARWFQKVVTKQNPTKGHLASAKAIVLNCYTQYIAAAPAVNDVPTPVLNQDQRIALFHAYDSETAPMTRLRGRLFGPIRARRCPSCGISEAGTLDHYLPKEDYPQYAIFAKNCVPCCATCNLQKKRLVVDQATDVRLFLHPYYDTIPNTSFLFVSVSLRRAVVILRFRLSKPANMPQRVFDHLQSHFDLLRLGDRYRVMSLDELRGQYRAICQQYEPDNNGERLSGFLAQAASTFAAEYGPNHWRAVLYAALADHDDFCDGGFAAIAQIR